MPTYEYECGDCGHRFDKLIVRINGTPTLTDCPNCGSEDTEKQLSAPAGFIFKGEGFYSTDSKGK